MMGNPVDILFVVPSFEPVLKDESIGTLILAKKLKLNGIRVDILRYWQCENFQYTDYKSFRHNFVNQILKKKPHIISFYCRCTEYHVCIDIAKRIKPLLPDVKIIFGGPQAELVAKETITSFDEVDFVSCSEGENTIVPLIHDLLHNTPTVYSIPGLCFRDIDGKIVQNPFPELLPKDYVRGYLYYDMIPSYIIPNSKSLTIDVGRGCPFGCTFCSTKTFWKQQFRLRSLEDIMNELRFVVSEFGLQKFDFDHDLFTVNKNKLLDFCQMVKDSDLGIKWYCSSRIDTISNDEIDKMAEAGMTNILFGVETGSLRMQRVINKKLNLNNVKDIIRYSVSRGIKTKVSFIYGFPEDTENDFEQTLRLIIDLQNLGAHVVVWKCGILNGTAMYEKFRDELYLPEHNWKNHTYFGFGENYELIKSHPDIFPHFYDHPNPLRSELEYFDLFYALWRDMERITFNNIADFFISSGRNLLDLYRCFVKANKTRLYGYEPHSFDKFWGLSYNDCQSLIENFIREARTYPVN